MIISNMDYGKKVKVINISLNTDYSDSDYSLQMKKIKCRDFEIQAYTLYLNSEISQEDTVDSSKWNVDGIEWLLLDASTLRKTG